MTQALARERYDLDEIKKRFDLRIEVEAALGRPTSHGGKWSTWPCPLHHETHGASLMVCADGWKCNGKCSHEKTLSIFDWDMQRNGWTFSQAVEFRNGGVSLTPRHTIYISPSTAAQWHRTEPPSPDWQRSKKELVEAAEQALWLPAGAEALENLHGRNLLDETIRTYRLGYDARRNAIVIPWLIGSVLWGIKYRNLSPDAENKYTAESGGAQMHALYGADTLWSELPVVFVEGEFDAMLGNQIAGDLACFVTVGSATSHLSQTWAEALADRPIILARDNDEAGALNAEKNTARLPAHRRVVTFPTGKDLTEFVSGGGDLRTWIGAVLNSDPAPIWRSTPDTWRAAIREHLPDSVQPLIERLGAAGMLVAGKTFSRQQALDLGLTIATVNRGIEGGEGVFWTRITVLHPLNTLQGSISKTVIGAQYQVLSLSEMSDNLLKRAAYRLWERCNPVDPDRPLPSVKSGYFEALGYSTDEAAQHAADLSAMLVSVYHRQGHEERFSEKRARGEYDRLKRSLADLRSVPLPSDWVYSDSREYVVALARGIKEAEPERNLTQKEWSEKLGVSERSASKIIDKAGIASVEQFQEVVVKSVDEAIRVGYELKGYPRRIVSAESRFDRARLSEEIAVHGSAVVSYQLVNKQTIATAGQPAKAERPSTNPLTKIHHKLTVAEPAAPKQPSLEPYFGPGYNPVYVRAWTVQALERARGYMLHSDGRLIDLETGEVITEEPTDRQLVDLLLGRPMEDPLLDPSFLAEIGATVTIEYHNESEVE